MTGIYKHYKGNIYRVLGVGTHSETLEEFVIYHPLDNPSKLWIRPFQMFFEKVEVNGETVERFKFIENG